MRRLICVVALILGSALAAPAPAPGSASGNQETAETAEKTEGLGRNAAPNIPHSTSPIPASPPFKYISATAFHILPVTHNRESGYGSLCEGLDGSIYIGTAKQGVNAYLVEFDPATQQQRIAVDAQKTCASETTGFAAQASIATPNFVAPSGRIYVGADHGTPSREDLDDKVAFGGGHVITYDPRIGQTQDLGIPRTGEGVSDVLADEQRGLLFAITSDHQHWMLGGLGAGGSASGGVKYRDLGPTLAPGATTIIDAHGIASALALMPLPPAPAPAPGNSAPGTPSPKSETGNQKSEMSSEPRPFQLVQYDPAAAHVTTRNILLPGQRFMHRSANDTPFWALAPDGHTAYLVLADDAMLLSIDLADTAPIVVAHTHGKLIDGVHPWLHAGLAFSPDGHLYTLVRVANQTGFGVGDVHHLVRFDPATGRSEDLGVIAVRNPDFFNFVPAGTPGKDAHIPAWCHGFQGFPDGTIAPMFEHQALRAARDGTLYATFLNPFTLVRIDNWKISASPMPPPSPTRQCVDAVLAACDRTERELDRFTQVAQVMAQRYINGGMIGFLDRPQPYLQCLNVELWGRGGGIVHIGFDRAWKKSRTAAEKANDMMIVDWERPPGPKELAQMRDFKKHGGYIVGLGPAAMPQIAQHLKLCDAIFDSGVEVDGVVQLPDGQGVGRVNPAVNCIRGWVLVGEFVAALTRQGHMPTMWKSYSYNDGKEWGNRYFEKMQFHDDFTIGPQTSGDLGREYLRRARYDLRAFAATQHEPMRRAADMIATEVGAKHKTLVAYTGHMPPGYVGKYDDAHWATNREFNYFIDSEVTDWEKTVPPGGLVVALAEMGLQDAQVAFHRKKKERVIAIAGQHSDPGYQGAFKADVFIYDFAPMGDACVPIEGYPIRILPTSGFMQAVVYESLDAEVWSRLPSGPTTAHAATQQAPASQPSRK